MEKSNKSGIVLRILSKDEIIIDIGKNQGARLGMKYEVYEEGEELKDENNESLGTLDYTKAIVEISKLYPNFSIAQHLTTHTEKVSSGIISAFSDTTKEVVKTIVHELPVDEESIVPLKVKEKNIVPNDPIRLIH